MSALYVSKPYADHGWIPSHFGGTPLRVCPGDWIILPDEDEDDDDLPPELYPISDKSLTINYIPETEIPGKIETNT